MHSESLQRRRNIVTAACDVTNVQRRGYFNICAGRLIRGRTIEEIRTQSCIAHRVVALFILLALEVRNGRDLVGLLRDGLRKYGERYRLLFAEMREPHRS